MGTQEDAAEEELDRSHRIESDRVESTGTNKDVLATAGQEIYRNNEALDAMHRI